MESILTQALKRRRALRDAAESADARTNAWRVIDGGADGMPGVTVDDFDGHWVISTLDRALPAGLEQAALKWAKSVWWRRLERGEKAAADWLAGARPDGPVIMHENGLRYEIDPSAGYSPGLFLDQRDNRRRVLERLAPGKKMLNLYAYTCGFSVAGAAAGAVTSSVDLSAPYLAWGQRNFELNSLNPGDHHFVRGDAFEWLAQFARKQRSFDLAVVDPPTFSRGGKRKVWKIERDLPDLVTATVNLLVPGAWLMVSSNCRRLHPDQFEDAIEQGIRACDRRATEHQRPPMPADFTGPPYLHCLWVRLE